MLTRSAGVAARTSLHELPRRRRPLSSLRMEWEKVKRAMGLLRDETIRSKDLLQSSQPKTGKDTVHLKKNAKDMARLIPFLGVAALPGGSMLVAVLTKLFPWTLPSTFADLNLPNELHHPKEKMDEMRSLVVEALKDLNQRVQAQPKTENEPLKRQLEDFARNPKVESLHFQKLFAVTDEDIMGVLDEGAIASMVAYFGLQAAKSREENEGVLHQHLTGVRADDRSLLVHMSEAKLTHSEIEAALRMRGLWTGSQTDREGVDALVAWLEITVARELPVGLAALARVLQLANDQ